MQVPCLTRALSNVAMGWKSGDIYRKQLRHIWAGDTSKELCPGSPEETEILTGKVCRKACGRSQTNRSPKQTQCMVQEEKISCQVTSKRIRGKRLNSVDTRAQCPGSHSEGMKCPSSSITGHWAVPFTRAPSWNRREGNQRRVYKRDWCALDWLVRIPFSTATGLHFSAFRIVCTFYTGSSQCHWSQDLHCAQVP